MPKFEAAIAHGPASNPLQVPAERPADGVVDMQTVTSISGGKTSSYMALKYPTDLYVFALVRSNHPELAPTNSSLLAYCEDKSPGFIGTYEAPETLQALREVEQMIGSEIKWLSAEYALEDYVFGATDVPNYRSGKPYLYNKRTRFCTIEQKIKPISRYCWLNSDGNPVVQNIGFRWDEPGRVEGWNCGNDVSKIATSCGMKPTDRWEYQNIEWRVSDFPLYRDRVTKLDVLKFWENKSVTFPDISNCVMCPIHQDSELRKQRKLYPKHYAVAVAQESAVEGHYFGSRSIVERTEDPGFDQPSLFSCLCSDSK